MNDESAVIIMLLTDGQQRTFKEIETTTGLDPSPLANQLKSLTDDGLIEQTVVPGEGLYLITAKGLLASLDCSA